MNSLVFIDIWNVIVKLTIGLALLSFRLYLAIELFEVNIIKINHFDWFECDSVLQLML